MNHTIMSQGRLKKKHCLPRRNINSDMEYVLISGPISDYFKKEEQKMVVSKSQLHIKTIAICEYTHLDIFMVLTRRNLSLRG